jgi:hypothetical protein
MDRFNCTNYFMTPTCEAEKIIFFWLDSGKKSTNKAGTGLLSRNYHSKVPALEYLYRLKRVEYADYYTWTGDRRRATIVLHYIICTRVLFCVFLRVRYWKLSFIVKLQKLWQKKRLGLHFVNLIIVVPPPYPVLVLRTILLLILWYYGNIWIRCYYAK